MKYLIVTGLSGAGKAFGFAPSLRRIQAEARAGKFGKTAALRYGIIIPAKRALEKMNHAHKRSKFKRY